MSKCIYLRKWECSMYKSSIKHTKAFKVVYLWIRNGFIFKILKQQPIIFFWHGMARTCMSNVKTFCNRNRFIFYWLICQKHMKIIHWCVLYIENKLNSLWSQLYLEYWDLSFYNYFFDIKMIFIFILPISIFMIKMENGHLYMETDTFSYAKPIRIVFNNY